MPIETIALFLPRDTPFYRALAGQMSRGFETLGLRVHSHLGHLDADAYRQWSAPRRPDAVFEMNRPRADAPFVPRGVPHVCWVVDFNGRDLAHFEGSEITYLFAPCWVERYPHRGLCRWLGPGACPEQYAPRAGPFAHPLSFVGHIPRPWSAAERERPLTAVDAALPAPTPTFGDIVAPIAEALRRDPLALVSVEEYLDFVDRWCRQRTTRPARLDDRLRYDLSGRLVRTENRQTLIDAALAGPGRLALFGSDNWRHWPRYAPHYRGALSLPSELCRVYAGSAINLHEGVGVHFRSMDAMASGGLVFHRASPEDGLTGGMAQVFEPSVHYVRFRPDDLPGQIAETLGDPVRAEAIRRAGCEAVRREHTWAARARQILGDLAQL